MSRLTSYKTGEDPQAFAVGMIEDAVSRWNTDYGRIDRVTLPDGAQHVVFATGGWSDNEDVIDWLLDDWVLMSTAWVKSERGGLYVFEVRQ